MPTPNQLTPLEILFNRGYWPSAPDVPPADFLGTIRRGSNVWIRSTGRPEVTNGLLEVSATNVGARIFPADIQRAVLAGGLVGPRLPYAGLIRYDNSVLFFLSEHVDQQLYLDESPVSGVTTSPTAGRLRIAVPNGVGGYDDFDAGFDKCPSIASSVSVGNGGGAPATRPMSGLIGVALARWRSKTNAIGPPSDVAYFDVSPNPTAGKRLLVDPPAEVSGQDGWVYLGTRWDDRSGEIRVVRYVYVAPPGTFTATNGSPNLTAGVGTRWFRDLRPGDAVRIDGTAYSIDAVTSDTTATLLSNFTGTGGAGKTMTLDGFIAGSWYDSELGSLVNQDTFPPPRAAGILKYAGRVFLFGVPDTRNLASSSATGNAIVALLPNNPEHVGLLAIGTQSGSDIVNALGADGPMYLMTTTSLEIVSFTSDPDEPYKIKIIAEPGFKDASNGVLDGDYFYGFNGQPFRTKASKNIDVEFAEAVQKVMKDWTGRVMLNTDPINKAVLYMHDDGASSIVIPFMTQLGIWGPELNFSARIIDSQVVNGKLYVTYLSGGVYRVQQWEGGAGIGGTRYVASQYYDPRLLARNRVKRLAFAGKAGTLRVYAAQEDAPVPDVSDTGAAAASFTLSDVDKVEPEIHTNIHGNGFAFRVDLSSNDGNIDKLVASGTPLGR